MKLEVYHDPYNKMVRFFGHFTEEELESSEEIIRRLSIGWKKETSERQPREVETA
jgi:hypothetical protein